jgi:hypothetical protein
MLRDTLFEKMTARASEINDSAPGTTHVWQHWQPIYNTAE